MLSFTLAIFLVPHHVSKLSIGKFERSHRASISPPKASGGAADASLLGHDGRREYFVGRLQLRATGIEDAYH